KTAYEFSRDWSSDVCSSDLNINTKNTDKEIELYNEKVISFLGERYSGSTIAEIFGSNKIISFKSKMLSPVLPYKVVAVVRDYHRSEERRVGKEGKFG